MRLQRFEVPGLSHYSYILESGASAVVVDPRRDFDLYVDYAAGRNLKITHVLETHIHADYASGALELAKATGAELWLSGHDTGEDFEYQFAHREAKDGDVLEVDGMKLQALYTPGHTPEHISFLVSENDRCPLALLSGDFVFVGSLGRPDLLGEAAKQKLAEQLYESVTRRLTGLPDGLEIHPAHGAGSMCGSGMGDRAHSTLGYERVCNVFFGTRDKKAFVDLILSTVPPFPEYYKRMKRVNSAGPKLLGGSPGGQAFSPREFHQVMEKEQAVVVDLRRPEAFGGAHIPGAFSVGAGALFSMWAAWVVPYDRPILLVSEEGDNEEARRGLIRVGLDEVRGYLKGGMKAWIEAGYPQAHVAQASVRELEARLQPDGIQVLDVRTDAEWRGGHIRGAQHIMGGYVAERVKEIPRDRPLYVICGSGYRSSVTASILKRAGFEDVTNVVGGMNAWRAAGLPVESTS